MAGLRKLCCLLVVVVVRGFVDRGPHDHALEPNVENPSPASGGLRWVRLQGEAVVFVADRMDECRQQRALAIARSSGNRTVYWLHQGPAFWRNWTAVTIARRAGIIVERLPQIPQWPGLLAFGGVRSRGAKSQMVLWAARQRYKHIWFIEDDIFFTGNWSKLFDAAPPDADVVAKFTDTPMFHLPSVPGEDEMRLQERLLRSGLFIGARNAFGCQLAPGVPCIRRSAVNAKQQLLAAEAAAAAVTDGRDIEIGSGNEELGPHRQALYGVIRMSHMFARLMVISLTEPNASIGHHEVITDPFCAYHGLRVANLPASSLKGTFTPGGWGPFLNNSTLADDLKLMKLEPLASFGYSRRLQRSPWVQSDALYHPTKCEADPGLGQRQLNYVYS